MRLNRRKNRCANAKASSNNARSQSNHMRCPIDNTADRNDIRHSLAQSKHKSVSGQKWPIRMLNWISGKIDTRTEKLSVNGVFWNSILSSYVVIKYIILTTSTYTLLQPLNEFLFLKKEIHRWSLQMGNNLQIAEINKFAADINTLEHRDPHKLLYANTIICIISHIRRHIR